MVTHLVLLKLHSEDATPSRREWVYSLAQPLFDAFPSCQFRWKTPLEHDLEKWDGLILIEASHFEEIEQVLNSQHYNRWSQQVAPFVGCIKGWSFSA